MLCFRTQRTWGSPVTVAAGRVQVVCVASMAPCYYCWTKWESGCPPCLHWNTRPGQGHLSAAPHGVVPALCVGSSCPCIDKSPDSPRGLLPPSGEHEGHLASPGAGDSGLHGRGEGLSSTAGLLWHPCTGFWGASAQCGQALHLAFTRGVGSGMQAYAVFAGAEQPWHAKHILAG